jgi:hypothetical protein
MESFMKSFGSKNINSVLILGFFLTILCNFCFADEPQPIQPIYQNLEQIENLEQLGNYIANYYKNPEPQKIPKFIDILCGDKDFLDSFSGAPIMTFLTRVVKDNPEKIKEWLEQIKTSDLNKLFYIYQAIWDSDTQQSRAFLQGLTNNADRLLARVARKITSRPPEEDVLTEKMLSGGWIDRAWAAYAANGDNNYLKRILKIAASKNFTEIYADDGLVDMAIWSLNSMRKKDKIVDEKVISLINENPKLEYRTNKEEL